MDGLSLMSTPDSCSRKTVHWGEVPHLFDSSLYSLSSWVSVLSGCPLNTPGQHLNIYPLCWRYASVQKRSTAKKQYFGGAQYWEHSPSSPPPLDNRSHPVPSHLRSSIFSEISLASMDWNSAPPRTLTGKMGRSDSNILKRFSPWLSYTLDHHAQANMIVIHTSIIIYILSVLNTIKLALFSPTNPYDLLMFTAFLGCFKMHQTQTPSLWWSFGYWPYVCHLRLLLASLSLRHPAATTCTFSINDHPPQTDLLTSPHLLTKKKASKKKKKLKKTLYSFELEDTSKNIPQKSPRVLVGGFRKYIIYIYPIPQNVSCPASSVDLPWDGSTHPRSRGS